MGRTLPSATMVFMQEEAAFGRFRRALRRSDQVALDDLFISARQHLAATQYAAHALPFEVMLLAMLPLIEQSKPLSAEHTLITADAGYHSDANVLALMEQGTAALIADHQMRQRDERFSEQAKHKAKDDPLYDKQSTQDGQVRPVKLFKPADFKFNGDNTCICPAGKQLISTGAIYTAGKGLRREDFKAKAQDCASCGLRGQCLRHPERTPARKVVFYHQRDIDPDDPSHRMRQAIDSARGRRLYSQRIGTVEPVFANIRHNKRMTRFNLRGHAKVNTQWHLYCMVHNIEKLANSGWMN